MQGRDLGFGIHLRGPRRILHGLTREHRPDLPVQMRDLPVVWVGGSDHRQVEFGRKHDALARAEPGLERKAAFGLEVRAGRIGLHHGGEGLRNVGDVGHHRTAGREHRVFRREDIVNPELGHEPLFLGLGIVVAAGHRAGVTDRAGQLRLPAPDHAGHHRLGEGGIELVETARLSIEDGGLGAGVIGEREGKLGRGVVDVHVLAARDQRGGAPAGHAEIGGDRGGEVAGVREDRDRALAQGLGRTVSAERPADADLVPGVRNAEAVAAEDVDPVLLAQGADLARVVHRQLLGDDEDLLELGIDPDQLGDAVPGAGRRQVDHTTVEAVPRLEALSDIVVDRDIADRRLENLAAAAWRGAEHHVPARVGMAHRCHVARLATQDVEHADPIVARGDLVERADAHVVLEAADALLEHCGSSNSFRVRGQLRRRPPPECAASPQLRLVRRLSSRHLRRGRN